MEKIFLKALYRKKLDRPPIWIMRQAGRYLPEYLQLKKEAGSFMNLCRNPQLACEVSLQPIRRFNFDAIIVFSDILTIPDAMGLGLEFKVNFGPYFHNPLRTTSDIKKLVIPDPEIELQYVMNAIRCIKQKGLPQALLGFAGSPWTLACYMIANNGVRFNTILTMLQEDRKLLHELLQILTQATILYLQAQINAGVDAIQLFDSWGHLLMNNEEIYQEFSLQYIEQIIHSLSAPSILFARESSTFLKKLANTGCKAVSIDHHTNLNIAQQLIGDKVALQGNFNPQFLATATVTQIQQKTQEILKIGSQKNGHIFNLGHGILKETPIENVQILVDTVKNYNNNNKPLFN